MPLRIEAVVNLSDAHFIDYALQRLASKALTIAESKNTPPAGKVQYEALYERCTALIKQRFKES